MAVAQIREIAAAQRLENVRYAIRDLALVADEVTGEDRKSTRLNSSHLVISYAVFCLKKKHRHDSTNRFDSRVLRLDLPLHLVGARFDDLGPVERVPGIGRSRFLRAHLRATPRGQLLH